jgi:hypothetical protein
VLTARQKKEDPAEIHLIPASPLLHHLFRTFRDLIVDEFDLQSEMKIVGALLVAFEQGAPAGS